MNRVRRILAGRLNTACNSILGFLPLLLGLQSLPAQAMEESFLVRDGKATSEIVIAEEPAPIVPIAAEELQRVLMEISGAELPIVTEPTGGDTTAVYVGRSPHTDALGIEVDDLDFDAYRMVSGDNWLALLGRDDEFMIPEPYDRSRDDLPRALEKFKEMTGLHISRLPTSRVAWREYSEELDLSQHDGRGTANAVYAFLYDLGFRWYFPGKIGQVIPEQTTIPLPQVDRTVHADFPLRSLDQYYHRFGQAQGTEDEIKWQLSLGLNSGYEARGLAAAGHGLSSITTGRYAYGEGPERDAFHAQHPEEFYALYGGERDIGANQCLSSEALFEMAVEYARAMFDIYDVRILDLSPEDGFSRLCQCPLCEGRDTPERGREGMLSDHVWGFINRVAEETYKTHPDHYIGGLAYSSYLLPPEQIEELSPNVAVMMCKWRTWHADGARYTPEEVEALRQAWLDILPSGKLMRWDYFLHARSSHGNPVVFPRLIAADLQRLKGKSLGEESEVFRNYDGWNRDWHALATNHLNLYVTARYLWDADQDIDVLLDDYYETYYGPASEQMREFMEYAEANWIRARSDAEVIDQLQELIATAREAAGDGIYGERVAMIETFMAPLEERRETLQAGREDNPRAEAHVRDLEQLSFDGKIEGPFWEFEAHELRDLETGGEVPNPTEVRFAWTDDYLVVGIRCTEADMENLNIATERDHDFNIWNGDLVEIHLETPEHQYYQIVLNPAGARMELDRASGLETQWSSGLETAIHHGENYWSMEMLIPLPGEGHAEFHPLEKISGGPPTADAPWHVNVCRQRVRGDEREMSAFSPTGHSRFNDVTKLGPFTLAPPEPD